MRVLKDGKISWVLESQGLRNPPSPTTNGTQNLLLKKIDKDSPLRWSRANWQFLAFPLPNLTTNLLTLQYGRTTWITRLLRDTDEFRLILQKHGMGLPVASLGTIVVIDLSGQVYHSSLTCHMNTTVQTLITDTTIMICQGKR